MSVLFGLGEFAFLFYIYIFFGNYIGTRTEQDRARHSAEREREREDVRTQHSPAQFSPNLISWAIIPFPIIDESLLFSLSSRSLINTPFSSSIYLFCSIENGFPSLYSNTHTHTHSHNHPTYIYTHIHVHFAFSLFALSVPHFFLLFSSHQHFHADASSISTLLTFQTQQYNHSSFL